jgi:hypothetical protein
VSEKGSSKPHPAANDHNTRPPSGFAPAPEIGDSLRRRGSGWAMGLKRRGAMERPRRDQPEAMVGAIRRVVANAIGHIFDRANDVLRLEWGAEFYRTSLSVENRASAVWPMQVATAETGRSFSWVGNGFCGGDREGGPVPNRPTRGRVWPERFLAISRMLRLSPLRSLNRSFLSIH